jgi:hypothetical protein
VLCYCCSCWLNISTTETKNYLEGNLQVGLVSVDSFVHKNHLIVSVFENISEQKMSSLSLRLVSVPDIYDKYHGASKSGNPYAESDFSNNEQHSKIGKYYGSDDFKLTSEINTNYLADHSPTSVDQLSGPSPSIPTAGLARDDHMGVKVPPSYFVGTSSRELSSSYSEPTRFCAPSLLTRQRSFTLPDHNRLDCFLQLEPAMSDGEFVNYTELAALVERADNGLHNGVLPVLAEGALGGTYFLRDKARAICLVCKPGDEEPNAVNNPHQVLAGDGLDPAYKGEILPGTGMYREVAAYVLDKGFAGVPPTHLARICHPSLFRAGTSAVALSVDSHDNWKAVEDRNRKICSVQQYARHECCAEDMGSTKFSVSDVQRLAFLDIRMLNLDRHEGNVLVSTSNPFQHNVGVAVGASELLVPVAEDKDLSVFNGDFRVGTASVVTEASASFMALAGSTKARLTPGPVVEAAEGRCDLALSLASSAPCATVNHMEAYFQQSEAGDRMATPSPRSTYASVTGGPAYVHPTPSPSYRLIPIDHGFSVPHVLHMESASLCWMNWHPQINEPMLPEVIYAIEAMDVDQDIASIKASVGDAIPEPFLLSLHVGAALLKAGAAAGLTLKQIGALLTNDNDSECGAFGNYDNETVYDKPARVQTAVEKALVDTLKVIDDEGSNVASNRNSVALTATDPMNKLSLADYEHLLYFALRSASNTGVFVDRLRFRVQELVVEIAVCAKCKSKQPRK